MNLNIIAIGVPNAVLEYCNDSEISVGDQIKYCKTVSRKLSEINLYYRVMNNWSDFPKKNE